MPTGGGRLAASTGTTLARTSDTEPSPRRGFLEPVGGFIAAERLRPTYQRDARAQAAHLDVVPVDVDRHACAGERQVRDV